MFCFLFLIVALFGFSRAELEDSGKENEDSYLLNSLLEERALPCPEEGWIRFRGGRNCYYLGRQKESWGAAKKKCREYGGDLVTVNGKNERNNLLEFLNESGSTVWIGAATVRDMGMGMISNCISISSEGISEWNDKYCSKRLKYICEKRVFTTLSWNYIHSLKLENLFLKIYKNCILLKLVPTIQQEVTRS